MARSTRAPQARGGELGAPQPPTGRRYELLTAADIIDAALQFGIEPDRRNQPEEAAERMNDALSEFIAGGDRAERRHAWFADVEDAARRLQSLLMHHENAALLLSGVGQPMLFMSNSGWVAKPLAWWRKTILHFTGSLGAVAANAGTGRETLERELFGVSVGEDGWPVAGTTRRHGRPPHKAWLHLADTGFDVWRHFSGHEPSVTVDPTADPVSRHSKAAEFVATLLDLAADRLPPELSEVGPLLLRQETRLIAHLERQKRSGRFKPSRRKRTKSPR